MKHFVFSRSTSPLITHVVLFFLATYSCEIFAYPYSGGHGGSGSFGLIILIIVFTIYFIIYIIKKLLCHYLITANHEKAIKVLTTITNVNPLEKNDQTVVRINKIFVNVINAWARNDIELAKNDITDNLYKFYKDENSEYNYTNCEMFITGVNLHKIIIVEANRYRDSSNNKFCACIKYAAIKYTIDNNINKIIDGKNSYQWPHELWHFKYKDNNWVLDNIEDATLSNIRKLASSIE